MSAPTERITTMTEIHDAVRAWARGIYPTEAGVELLIRQGKAIREGAPWLIESESSGSDRPRMVGIDVEQLLEYTGAWSGGERRLVRIAASLLGGPAVDLSENVSGLDRGVIDLVLAAVAHASGSHEHSQFTRDESGRPNGSVQLPALYPWPEE
jgi:hypothetical protein